MSTFDWEGEAELKWDNQAESWSSRSRHMWEKGSRMDVIPFLEDNLPKGSKILDIGCADGYGSLKLAKAGYHVIGTDISGEMIRRAKDQATPGQATFIKGDVNDLPFGDREFDGIMAINVLEWTADPAKALKEIFRVVKENGLLCIGLLGPTAGPRMNSYPRLQGKNAICNTMMPWEFEKLAFEMGLEYVDGYGVYKKGVKENQYKDLPRELRQALTFLWVFMLRKVDKG
ncbi:class I SAM-dependent methyltransferase [Virgibacillus sp. YIM 98842]|uniref:class I SAM-dependent methyltransferase n=1 Tax=Virgibacillus sp. YIM 98842 TaxID=2663533 RepID=UPI0013DC8007|nr:class I SAM-dependent methyltransferase [Virgibacillus sp. YIM 98842]